MNARFDAARQGASSARFDGGLRLLEHLAGAIEAASAPEPVGAFADLPLGDGVAEADAHGTE